MSKRQDHYFKLDPNSGSVSMAMLSQMHPAVVLMIAWTNLWCYNNGIKPVWTSWMRTPEQNKRLGATSVHEYRAADLSIRSKHGWTKELLEQFEQEFSYEFLDVGALVNIDGELYSRPILVHDNGNGNHAHMQCRP